MPIDRTYNTKKFITIIFLLLTLIIPLLGIIGVIFMWMWMKWKPWIKVLITIPIIIGPMMIVNYLFLFSPIQIKGEAMAPNYVEGQFYITNVFAKNLDMKRGDVIVFKSPKNPDIDYIKRIIGLPNERISIQGGKVYINGSMLDESKYLVSNVTTQILQSGYISEGQEIIISPNSYFVLGDNRPKSSDSRDFGPINKSEIKSKIAFCYYGCK